MPAENYNEIQMARALTKSVFANRNNAPKISVVTKKAGKKSIKPQVSFIFAMPKKK